MQPKKTGKPADQRMPAAELTAMMTHYQHRLLSLEAELHEFARCGVVSEAEFKRRIQHLHQLHADLAALGECTEAEAEGEVTTGDIGLPVMGACTPAEARVCAQYLQEKSADLAALTLTIGRLHHWLQGLLTGRVGFLRLTFRLSKLRQMILIVERATDTLRQQEGQLGKQVASLLHSVKGTRSQQEGASTLQALKAMFMQLDAATQRVARLTAAVKREEARVQAMLAWLAKERRERAAVRPAMDPPTPFALARAAAAGGFEMQATLPEQRRRRALAEQFCREYCGPKRATPPPVALRQAAALLAPLSSKREGKA